MLGWTLLTAASELVAVVELPRPAPRQDSDQVSGILPSCPCRVLRPILGPCMCAARQNLCLIHHPIMVQE